MLKVCEEVLGHEVHFLDVLCLRGVRLFRPTAGADAGENLALLPDRGFSLRFGVLEVCDGGFGFGNLGILLLADEVVDEVQELVLAKGGEDKKLAEGVEGIRAYDAGVEILTVVPVQE